MSTEYPSTLNPKQICENIDKVLGNKPPSPVSLCVPLSETLRRLNHLKKNGHISPKQSQQVRKLLL